MSKDLEEVIKESIGISLGSILKADKRANFKSIRLEHAFYVNKYNKEAHVPKDK